MGKADPADTIAMNLTNSSAAVSRQPERRISIKHEVAKILARSLELRITYPKRPFPARPGHGAEVQPSVRAWL